MQARRSQSRASAKNRYSLSPRPSQQLALDQEHQVLNSTVTIERLLRVLSCHEVELNYGSGFALGPITADFGPGVTCIVGVNGAGKSTLFRVLAGVQKPRHGNVSRADNLQIGYLPQDVDLPSRATCSDFLHYVAWLYNVAAVSRQRAVRSALEQVKLGEFERRRIKTLSGGMQRRLAIAHALVHDPKILLLDEPTSGLDPIQRLSIRKLIAALGSRRTVIVATHLLEDVRALDANILLLANGKALFTGGVAELEAKGDPQAPGDSHLERAMATLMGVVS